MVPAGSKLPAALRKRYDKRVAQQRKSTPTSGGGTPRIGVSGEQLVLPNGSFVDTLDVVAIVGLRTNKFYEGAYDPNDVKPPVCGAIAPLDTHENDMAPTEGWASRQSESCTGCEMNPRGGRKRCRNGVDLIVVSTDALKSPAAVKDTTLFRVQLSSTSIQNWGSLVDFTGEAGAPVFAAKIRLGRMQEKTWQRTTVEFLDWIPNTKITDALEARVDEAAEILMKDNQPAIQLAVGAGGEVGVAGNGKPTPRRRSKSKAAAKKGRL